MRSEFPGTDDLRRVLASESLQLRQEVLKKLVLPNKNALRSGNNKRVGDEGWYTAIAATLPISSDCPDFEIPSECANWYLPERDERGNLVFRFFNRTAWLWLPVPKRACNLEFLVVHTLMSEAVGALKVTVNEIRMAIENRGLDSFGRAQLTVQIPDRTWEFLAGAERLRFQIDCPISGVPSMMYKGSTDTRRLSCAITFPRPIADP
jgi:hypothetical protein